MNRRRAVAALMALAAVPAGLRAQASRTYRIALVFVPPEAVVKPLETAVIEGLRARGYVQGRNLAFAVRYANADARRVPSLVDEVIALRPDVLMGFESVALVMKAKTSSIPIVLTHSSDPVGLGLAESLARPGANVTGISMLHEQALSKVLEIFRQILPRLSRIGLVLDSTTRGSALAEEQARRVAAALGVSLVVYRASNSAELDQAVAKIPHDRLDALTIGATVPALWSLIGKVTAELARLRVPFAYPGSAQWDSTALFSFGADLPQAYRDAAQYADRILKGAKPAELPIKQPTRFELVINMNRAKALGIAIPQSVLLRADRVIE